MIVRSTRSVICACLVALLFGATAATAQITTGTVLGTVKDSTGGVVPGATVVLISDTRGTKSLPAVTNATGDYDWALFRAVKVIVGDAQLDPNRTWSPKLRAEWIRRNVGGSRSP